jgi:signal transduction histidine kinase
MYLMPGRETIPFHLVWLGLCLMYGVARWNPIEATVMAGATALATGAVLWRSAAQGWIDWLDIAEVPLSVAVTVVVAVYLRNRHLALAQIARMAQLERDRTDARYLLVRQVSHELRTPLTVARGYTELVRASLQNPAAVADSDVILDELDKLTQITNRLLTMIQIDGELDRHPLILGAELDHIVGRWKPAARRHWIISGPQLPVLANRERLGVALDCLLDNAVRHTGPNDCIEVIGAVDRDSWTVEVRDTGSGIVDTEVIPSTVSDAAFRGGASSGTGLGLPTVRMIAGTWGGTVKISSESGRGTHVTLRFPTSE